MKLIGITGLARSGKDTLASHLVHKHGFTLYKMAFPLKKLIAARFGLTFCEVDGGEWRDKPDMQFGWKSNQCCNYFSIRSWMQWLGTEVGRETFGEDCWTDVMESEYRGLKGQSMVVSDIRFDNEAQRIQDLGGIVVRVVRPGAAEVEAHVSEKGVSNHLIECDILNNASIKAFLERADAMLGL